MSKPSAKKSPQAEPKSETPRLKTQPLKLPEKWAFRVFCVYSSSVLMTGIVSMLFADLLWRSGDWTFASTLLLTLFVILFFLASAGCVNAISGFLVRLLGDDEGITHRRPYQDQTLDDSSTAIIVPIYNEDVQRVYEGLRATYESIEKTGHIQRFDFFILSDSTNPDKWVEEERLWYDVIRELGALGRIYYRRRTNNEGKKSGNVQDFLNNWGRRYRYFIVLDADSVMTGATVVDLVKMMEVNPEVGLIQTVPGLVNAESLFGRIQQFANRFYAPIFISGLNFWSQGFGNYWGHNAIIRTDPFMTYCDLPKLPGRKPFGGQILSHDFVEAALLLKENWQVWLAHDLGGSYEEAPQGLIENAQRDRRWCQGNLQHSLLLLAEGLKGISRLHLLFGIFGYLSGPLWFLFLITFNWLWASQKLSGLSNITVHSWTSYLNLSGSEHAFLLFLICMGVLMLPKVLAILDLARTPSRWQSYGGLPRVVASTVVETAFSTLHAPMQMLWHLRFVITILLGIGVSWGTQNWVADGTSWGYAIRRCWGHTLIGLVWGGLVWWLAPSMFAWFVPVFSGMVLAVPLSVFTSRSSWGSRARSMGLFLTPEETSQTPELDTMRVRMAAFEGEIGLIRHPNDSGLTEGVLDPYVNAVHVSLLREKELNPNYSQELKSLGTGTDAVRTLGEKLLSQGPSALSKSEKLLVMCDAQVMSWLHRQVWLRPGNTLAQPWRSAIRRYARQ
jgi:membrane glycosyltransferase